MTGTWRRLAVDLLCGALGGAAVLAAGAVAVHVISQIQDRTEQQR